MSSILFLDVLRETDVIQLGDVASDSRIILDVSPSLPTSILSASTSSLRSLQLIDMASKKPSWQVSPNFPDGHSPLHCMTFAGGHDNQHVVSCNGSNGTLSLWDLRLSPSLPVAATSQATPTNPAPSPPYA